MKIGALRCKLYPQMAVDDQHMSSGIYMSMAAVVSGGRDGLLALRQDGSLSCDVS